MNDTWVAYDAASDAWDAGPRVVYDRLAERAVARLPVPIEGRRVLDIGAGTGAGCRAVAAAGGRPVAVDAAPGMAQRCRAGGFPSACGDGATLPFRSGSFDAAVALFSLTHLVDPTAGLREAARIVVPGGAVAATGFARGSVQHPAKAAVEAAAARFGWRPPPWYLDLTTRIHATLGDGDQLASAARSAGLVDVDVTEEAVDVGPLPATALVAYRLGMPSLAPFVDGLDAATRTALTETALALLGPEPPPVCPVVVLLGARVSADGRGARDGLPPAR